MELLGVDAFAARLLDGRAVAIVVVAYVQALPAVDVGAGALGPGFVLLDELYAPGLLRHVRIVPVVAVPQLNSGVQLDVVPHPCDRVIPGRGGAGAES
ncbi:hypothetical protein J5X84_38640 [Streptosporangiaceae bacterium NEAU-GS5]|nr:hypothetical protein [Streptosporangiaceae bacterium NEAU-GS5]